MQGKLLDHMLPLANELILFQLEDKLPGVYYFQLNTF